MTTYEGAKAPINKTKIVQAIKTLAILFWAYPAFWFWVWFIERIIK